MALNVSIHTALAAPQGVALQAPVFDVGTLAIVVALNNASAAIVGPCLVCLVADEDERIDFNLTATFVNPTSTGVKLKAGVERYYNIVTPGPWYISCITG